jgi:guanylate kinase
MSPTAVRTHVRNLEANGYLKRDMRVGTTNVFHLTPLFEKLEERRAQVEAQPSRRRKRRLKVAESEADE